MLMVLHLVANSVAHWVVKMVYRMADESAACLAVQMVVQMDA